VKLLLLLLALIQPVHSAESERLAAHIVTIQPRAVLYARPLANAIHREAARHHLDPTVLAAIVWMESWYDRRAKGSDLERGLWQIYPRASYLGLYWEVYRRSNRIPSRWNRPWYKLSVATRQDITRDVEIGTVLAVELMSVFVRHCRRKHRDHRRPTDPYAHYNSGFRWPRPGYSYKLWRRTQIVRRAVGRPAVTDVERRWMERMGR
jgi:hypothetical protein